MLTDYAGTNREKTYSMIEDSLLQPTQPLNWQHHQQDFEKTFIIPSFLPKPTMLPLTSELLHEQLVQNSPISLNENNQHNHTSVDHFFYTTSPHYDFMTPPSPNTPSSISIYQQNTSMLSQNPTGNNYQPLIPNLTCSDLGSLIDDSFLTEQVTSKSHDSKHAVTKKKKTSRGRKSRKTKDSLPKHPMSGYLHFAKKMRPIIKTNNPQAKLVDISREIGSLWRAMSTQEQQPWIDLSNQDKARYKKEMSQLKDVNLTSWSTKQNHSLLS